MSDRTVLEEEAREKGRETSDGVARFCFLSERERRWDRQELYVCMQGAGTLGNFIFFSCLWSLLRFEVTLGKGVAEGGSRAEVTASSHLN